MARIKYFNPTINDWVYADGNGIGGSEELTSEDILNIMAEITFISPVANNENALYTDSTGNVYIL